MVNVLELNKELLIWVGFTFTNGVWTYPDGVTVDGNTPFFPASLDECITWIFPKLESYELRLNHGKHCAWLKLPTKYIEFGMAETPALAFCLAVRKLINDED